MSWFREPPVYSDVAPRALISGASALFRNSESMRDIVEAALLRRYDANEVLLTQSGTAALIVALRAFAGRGGVVALPGYGCIDITAAAVRAGVRVRLYDLDPATLSPDLDSVKRVIQRGVDAIVVAHLYGYPADVAGVQELASRAGIRVIEDAAQSAGGTLCGTRLGALADVSILSFGRGKGTTAGSGGALVLRNRADSESIRQNGLELRPGSRGGRELTALAAQWILARPLLYRIPAAIPALKLGEMVYHPAEEPSGMSVAAAAMLPAALAMEDAVVKARRARAINILSSVGEGRRLIPVRAVAGGESGYLRLPLLDRTGDVRPRESLGAIRGYPMTLDQHEQLRPILLSSETSGAGSVMLRDRLFTVPTHSRVRDVDVARLVGWIAEPRVHVPVEAWAT